MIWMLFLWLLILVLPHLFFAEWFWFFLTSRSVCLGAELFFKTGRSILVKGIYRRSVVNTFQTYGYGILPQKKIII
jgi:hypothetical protein